MAEHRLNNEHELGAIRYHYDQAGQMIGQTGVDGLSKYYFYDAQGRLQAQIAKNGVVTEYQYNQNGDLIQTTIYQYRVEWYALQLTV